MTREEEQEKARKATVTAQAKLDRDRELARRKARTEQATRSVSVIAHGPAQK